MRRGYKHGDRLLRPAMVGVTDPVHGGSAAADADDADLQLSEEAVLDQPTTDDGQDAH